MDRNLKIVYGVLFFIIASSIIILPLISSSPALIDNLLGYWKLDDDATDAHTNGYNLTAVNSPTYAAGIINNGSDLESTSSQYFTRAAGDLYPTLPFSVNVWVKFESLPLQWVIAKDSSAAGHERYAILYHTADTKIWALVHNATATSISVKSTTTPSTGNWYMLTLVANGTDLKIYINESLEGTPVALTSVYHVAEQPFRIGSTSFAAGFYTDGVVDEVGVWDKALTQGEITALYNSGNGLAYPFVVDTCTCPGAGNNWEIAMSDYCNITEACDLTTGTLNFTGAGWCNCNASVDTTNLGDPGASGILYIQDSCLIMID